MKGSASDLNPDLQIPHPVCWPEFFFSTPSISLHNTGNRWPCWGGFYFVIEISPQGQLWLSLRSSSACCGINTLSNTCPFTEALSSPNFFVPTYICQLYNPFTASKSFGKQQIKAGIIKGFLLKHAFLEAQSTMPSVLPL